MIWGRDYGWRVLIFISIKWALYATHHFSTARFDVRRGRPTPGVLFGVLKPPRRRDLREIRARPNDNSAIFLHLARWTSSRYVTASNDPAPHPTPPHPDPPYKANFQQEGAGFPTGASQVAPCKRTPIDRKPESMARWEVRRGEIPPALT